MKRSDINFFKAMAAVVVGLLSSAPQLTLAMVVIAVWFFLASVYYSVVEAKEGR